MATKLLVLAGFAIAFAAGWTTAIHSRGVSIAPAAAPTTRPDRASWLTSELNLSAQQREQLTKIWDQTARGPMHQRDDRRRELRQQRDEAISKIIRPEDRAAYDSVMKDFANQSAAIENENRAAFASAVEKTKQILDSNQREKYETILQQNQWNRRNRDRETTAPAN